MIAAPNRKRRNKWLAWAALLGLTVGAEGRGAAQSARVAAPKPESTTADPSAAPQAAPNPAGDPKAGVRPPPRLPGDSFAVPIVRQEQSYSCGPAALVAILRYFRAWDGPEQALYQPLGTSPAEGTLPEKLAAVARGLGLQASVEQRMTIEKLRQALRRGQVVIVELQAWPTPGSAPQPWSSRWDDGHYVVLIGLDAHYAYFMDPSTSGAYTYLPLDELVARWHDINEARKDPKLFRDYQLGVLIGPAARPTALPSLAATSLATSLATLPPRATSSTKPAPPKSAIFPPPGRLVKLD